MLIGLGAKRLKVTCDNRLSSFAFHLSLRRYNAVRALTVPGHGGLPRQPRAQGWAVQIDPIKPALKAPGIKRLELINDGPLSNIAFNFNLRRHSKDITVLMLSSRVGRCRLTLSKPC
jgi:hypothetical protein